MVRFGLVSDTNTGHGGDELSDSRATSQSMMRPDQGVGSATNRKRLSLLLSNWRMRFVSLEFKSSKWKLKIA